MKRTLLAGLVGAVVAFQVTANVDRVRYLTEGLTFESGSGSPEGLVTAVPGSGYYRSLDGSWWKKLTGTGATGWVNTSESLVNLVFLAGICQGASSTLGFSTPAANPAVAACVTGSNTTFAVAQFANGSNLSFQHHFPLSRQETDTRGAWIVGSSIDVDGTWRTSATTGSVVWQIQTAYVCAGGSVDPSFNTANTVIDVAEGTTNRANNFQILGISDTGAAANCELFFKFFRDSGHASDDLAATAELVQIRFTIRRQG